MGRYSSSDLIGLKGGLNYYSYAKQNPITYSDYNGENAALAWCIAGPVTCAAGIGVTVGALILMSPSVQKTLKKALSHACRDEEDEPDCRKANAWDLAEARIDDPHAYKEEHGAKPWSRFDICKCKDGTIRIAPVGTCGKTNKFWE